MNWLSIVSIDKLQILTMQVKIILQKSYWERQHSTPKDYLIQQENWELVLKVKCFGLKRSNIEVWYCPNHPYYQHRDRCLHFRFVKHPFQGENLKQSVVQGTRLFFEQISPSSLNHYISCRVYIVLCTHFIIEKQLSKSKWYKLPNASHVTKEIHRKQWVQEETLLNKS